MNDSDKFSTRNRVQSFSYAFKGIASMLKSEPNARIHFLATVCVVILGILFKISTFEWISVVVVIGLVFLSELFNTAIEKLADVVDPEWNIKIGQVKDMSAGAVLVSALISIIVGCLVFIPKIIALF